MVQVQRNIQQVPHKFEQVQTSLYLLLAPFAFSLKTYQTSIPQVAQKSGQKHNKYPTSIAQVPYKSKQVWSPCAIQANRGTLTKNKYAKKCGSKQETSIFMFFYLKNLQKRCFEARFWWILIPQHNISTFIMYLRDV
jgi:hypothetical protein